MPGSASGRMPVGWGQLCLAALASIPPSLSVFHWGLLAEGGRQPCKWKAEVLVREVLSLAREECMPAEGCRWRGRG